MCAYVSLQPLLLYLSRVNCVIVSFKRELTAILCPFVHENHFNVQILSLMTFIVELLAKLLYIKKQLREKCCHVLQLLHTQQNIFNNKFTQKHLLQGTCMP